MIYNEESKEVLVLDKVVKEGWEGLTFPGGHVEAGESLVDSVVREVKEETNLTIENPRLVGCIQWITEGRKGEQRQLGLLYRTENFRGQLVEENREGRLFWMKYGDFRLKENKSLSMDDILKVYEGACQEVIFNYQELKDGSFQLKNKEYR